MTPTEINKKCHEKLGLHWHEWKPSKIDDDGWLWRECICGDKWSDSSTDKQHRNTDFFNDPVALLMELEKWEHGKLFFAKLIYAGDNVEAVDDDGYISREYMTTPGLLATKLCEWEE